MIDPSRMQYAQPILLPLRASPYVSSGHESRWRIDLLLFWLSIVACAAWLGTQYGPDPWYATLRKPAFSPPDTLFASLSSASYLSMALAAWLVAREPGVRDQHRQVVLLVFTVQLLLNAAWPPLLFGAHALALSFLTLVALWIAIATTILGFAGVRALAAWLLAPCLLLTTFALVLNGTIWLINI